MKLKLSVLSVVVLTVAMFAQARLQRVTNLDYHKGFTVDTPVVLTTDGVTQGTTTSGAPYAANRFVGDMPNGDTYNVSVSEYGFMLTPEDLTRATNGFATALQGTVVSSEDATVSGYPAKRSIITATVDGREIKFATLITERTNVAYIFAFGSWVDSKGTDIVAVKTFFTSARLN